MTDDARQRAREFAHICWLAVHSHVGSREESEQRLADALLAFADAETRQPPIDLMNTLHDIFTRYGIASRTQTHLVTDVIRWAAQACRQTHADAEGQREKEPTLIPPHFRLVFNTETRCIEKRRISDGLAVESFEPPEEKL